jgi:hypothetical protein
VDGRNVFRPFWLIPRYKKIVDKYDMILVNKHSIINLCDDANCQHWPDNKAVHYFIIVLTKFLCLQARREKYGA